MYLSLSDFFGDRNTQTGEDGVGERKMHTRWEGGCWRQGCIISVYEHTAPGGCRCVTDSYSWRRFNGQMHSLLTLLWDFDSLSEHQGPHVTPVHPSSRELAPGLPQGHSSSWGAERLRAALPKPLSFAMFPGRGSSARLSAHGCSQPGAGLAIATASRYTQLPSLTSPLWRASWSIFLRKEKKGSMQRTWQGSGPAAVKYRLSQSFPLDGYKKKWHRTRSLYLTGLHAELSPCSPTDNDPSPISDFVSHGNPTQGAMKREGLKNQRSPLQLTFRTGLCNSKADQLFTYTCRDTHFTQT